MTTASLTFDKSRTKEYLKPFGVHVAQSFAAKKTDDKNALMQNIDRHLSYSCICQAQIRTDQKLWRV
jgi:D-alanine-D-alanine ligase-like ATP-grasp enzyme